MPADEVDANAHSGATTLTSRTLNWTENLILAKKVSYAFLISEVPAKDGMFCGIITPYEIVEVSLVIRKSDKSSSFSGEKQRTPCVGKLILEAMKMHQ